MQIEFRFLADEPQEVARVIDWWATAWRAQMGDDLEPQRQQLRGSLSKTDLPVHVLAYCDGVPAGGAALKLQELEHLYPQCQYWLGSVFVAPAFRGAGLAGKLSLHIVELAKARGLPHLYLQTVAADGGLYARLGWQPVEPFIDDNEDRLLMKKVL